MTQEQPLIIVDEPNGNQPVQADNANEHFNRLITVIRDRWLWAALLAVVLGPALAVATFYMIQLKYEARATVTILPEVPQVIESWNAGDKDVPPMFQMFVDDQVQVMASDRILRQAMASDTWKSVPGSEQITTPSEFLSHLSADRITRRGYTLRVAFEHPNPELTAAGVNALIDAYVDYSAQPSGSDSRVARVLSERRTSLTNELRTLRERKTALTREMGAGSIKKRLDARFEELTELEAMLRQVALELNEISQQGQRDIASMSLEELAANDARLQAYLDQRTALENQIMELEQMQMLENHPTMTRAKARLRAVQERLDQYVSQIQSGEIVISSAADGSATLTAEQLRQRHEQLTEMTAQTREQVLELEQLNQKVVDIDGRIAEVESRLKQTEFEIERRAVESEVTGRVQARSLATIPTEPYNKTSRLKYSAAAGVMGVFFGCALVLGIGMADPRLRHIDDCRLGLGEERMLGVLPTLPDNLADPDQAELAALSVHHIRTLLQISSSNAKNVYVVTSPAAGSGKSSLTAALGLSFAASGMRTLLIDCDIVGAGLTERLGTVVRRPLEWLIQQQHLLDDATLARTVEAAKRADEPLADLLAQRNLLPQEKIEELKQLQKSSSIGLLDVNRGEPLEDCIAPVGIGELYVLPVGSAGHRDAGMLSPKVIKSMIDQARDQFDTVLIDTGPISGSLEASMAAAQADGVIFVVARGEQRQSTTAALRSLQGVGARLAGLVFNHALDTDIERSSYGSMSTSHSRSQHRQGAVTPNAEAQEVAATLRFGPLATAVASYGLADEQLKSNGTNVTNVSRQENDHAA